MTSFYEYINRLSYKNALFFIYDNENDEVDNFL